MIVQACLNGARPVSFHPALPVTAPAIVAEAVAAIAAGAAEIHVHPRGADGRESLAPEVIDGTVKALRAALPGTLIGVSTGDWIERDDERRLAFIDAWRSPPDYASVNLREEAAPRVIERLLKRGIGVEAGIATAADAERFVALPTAHRVLRVLIEIAEQDWEAAAAQADAIDDVLRRAFLDRPVLLHGFDAMMWPFVERAGERRRSTRVGLEDGANLPDGTLAKDNAELVTAACHILRQPADSGAPVPPR